MGSVVEIKKNSGTKASEDAGDDDKTVALGLNVGELRKALEGLPDEMDVVVRGPNDFVGGIVMADQETHHDTYFAIDCSDDDSEFGEDEDEDDEDDDDSEDEEDDEDDDES